MDGGRGGGREGLSPRQDGGQCDGSETTHIQEGIQCHTPQQQLRLQLDHHDDGKSCDHSSGSCDHSSGSCDHSFESCDHSSGS